MATLGLLPASGTKYVIQPDRAEENSHRAHQDHEIGGKKIHNEFMRIVEAIGSCERVNPQKQKKDRKGPYHDMLTPPPGCVCRENGEYPLIFIF